MERIDQRTETGCICDAIPFVRTYGENNNVRSLIHTLQIKLQLTWSGGAPATAPTAAHSGAASMLSPLGQYARHQRVHLDESLVVATSVHQPFNTRNHLEINLTNLLAHGYRFYH